MEVKLKRSALEKRLSSLNEQLSREQEKSTRVMNNIGWGAGMRRTKVAPSFCKEDEIKEKIAVVKQALTDCKEEQQKTYTIKTRFVFEGEFYITAKNRVQAKEFIEKHCGLVIGSDIQTTLPDDMIDWNFDVHAQKIIR